MVQQFNSVNTNLSATVGKTAEQQSFLGATIQAFGVSAGFGDASSQLNVDLVIDNEFNSDGNGLDDGIDPYHSGNGDRFQPPPVGTPVFFSYGRFRASTQEAFMRTIDDYYGSSYGSSQLGGKMQLNPNGTYKVGNKGYYHFAFGGLLQSYVETRTTEGGLRYSVTVTDPREILSNCILILNNYTGTTFSNANVWNLFGCLEHNAIDPALRAQNDPDIIVGYETTKDVLAADGVGMDIYIEDGKANLQARGNTNVASKTKGTTGELNQDYNYYVQALNDFYARPMTGTGMSRRTSSGIPYYRVIQAFNYLQFGSPHVEYNQYGGYVFFRGLKYALDLSDVPILPKTYMLDYDQISILDLIQEICEVRNHEVFFSLLPIVSSSATASFPSNCVGVIKANVIDKNNPSEPGKIKQYINQIVETTDVTNSQIGYELTNEPTDKMVTGGKEASFYYFPTPYGGPAHGMHQYTTRQPIIPFYGTVGAYNVPTIPRGYGSYQQICLDASSLTADGVGRFYIATEIELRAASVSFEKWCEFLLMYSNMFKESVEDNDIKDLYYAQTEFAGENAGVFSLSNNYKITVPRCVWPPHSEENKINNDGVPENPCHPPYGWPLYWQRARNIGLPRAGAAGVSAEAAQIINEADRENGAIVGNDALNPTGAGEPTPNDILVRKNQGAGSPFTIMDDELPASAPASGVIAQSKVTNAITSIAISDKLSRKGLQNAKIIYQFLKKIADDCLGKKYLVTIPQRPNANYSPNILTQYDNENYVGGKSPYGFPATGASTEISVNGVQYTLPTLGGTTDAKLLDYLKYERSTLGGGLQTNWHKVINEYSYNYAPSKDGGWYGWSATPTESNRKKWLLEPFDNNFLRGSNNRLQCYARFSNAHTISFAGFNKSDYSQQFSNPTSDQYTPDLNFSMENSNNPDDKLSQDIPSFSPVTVAGQSFTPNQSVAFVKCDLDQDFYIAPPTKWHGGEKVYGGQSTFETISPEPGKKWNPETCKEEDTYAVSFQHHKPVPFSTGTASLWSMNLDMLHNGSSKGDARNGVFALITMPDRAVPVFSTTFRDGMNMQVNAANIKHYLMLDVVRGMPGITNQPGLRPVNSILHHANSIPNENDDNDIANRSSADAAVKKAYQGLTFDLTNRINIMSPSPVIPDLVALPLISEERSYGPWFSSYSAYDKIGGKVDYVHDENLTPWNYGSYTLMDRAGRLKVELATSAQLMVEKGSFNLPMYPSGLTLGVSLAGYGPNVTNLNVRVDAQGVETSVVMETYTLSFGKIQKQREDQLRKLNREAQKLSDLNNSLIRKNMAKSQKGFNYNSAIKALENRLSAPTFSERNYSNLERTTSSNSSTKLSMTVDPKPSNKFNPNGKEYSSGYYPDDVSEANLQRSASLQGEEAYAFMASMLGVDVVQAAKVFQNSVQTQVTELFAPIAAGWHQAFTIAPPSTPPASRIDYQDQYNDESLSTHTSD
jgi:hypothetical protein